MTRPPSPWGRRQGAPYVAGLGASAGGLEAMVALFSALQPTGQVAFVVAQHMAHDAHTELLVRVLGRHSRLPVVLGEDGALLEPDVIHIIPAGFDGFVEGGALKLRPPGPESLSSPSVNALFTSLARDRGSRAIGLILSGTGSDGRTGCRELKRLGGWTLAQEPSEARFNGMPGSALEAGAIDRALPAEALGRALAERFRPPVPLPPRRSATWEAGSRISPEEREELDRLLPRIHRETGIDFSSYKEETLLRRLEKRKATLGLKRAEDYLAYAQRHPAELRILQEHFLVSVSSFFRDPPSFEALSRALEQLLGQSPGLDVLRVWVAGCASGEEAWSLAILLRELREQGRCPQEIRIVGTDLNPEALETAAKGVYRAGVLRELSPGLQARSFTPRGSHFEVAPPLRELVSFEQRDLLTGPPGEGLALVSCRNVLIYLKSHLQDALLESIHRALVPRGLLFLGHAETPGFASVPLFAPVEPQHRVYRRRN